MSNKVITPQDAQQAVHAACDLADLATRSAREIVEAAGELTPQIEQQFAELSEACSLYRANVIQELKRHESPS